MIQGLVKIQWPEMDERYCKEKAKEVIRGKLQFEITAIKSILQDCIIIFATGGGHLWIKGARRGVSKGNRYGEGLNPVCFIIFGKV